MSRRQIPPGAKSPAGAVSRRNFLRGTAGAVGGGVVLGSGLWGSNSALAADACMVDTRFNPPVQSANASLGVPNPIPHFFFFPGPADSGDPCVGDDPSVINDFDGFVGVADIFLTGTGTDTKTGRSARYRWNGDMRFMKGTFIGNDGLSHQGAFVLI